MHSFMKKIVSGIAVIVAIVIGIPSMQYGWNVLRGHPMGGLSVAAEISKKIAENHLDPKLCLKIEDNPFDLYKYPPIGSIRRGCIDGVASRTQDPSACELLLPGEYGLACISNLWPEVSGHVACGWNYSDPDIFECRDTDGKLHQGENCKDFMGNPMQFSACLSYSAERNHDADQCNAIPDRLIRSFCVVKVNAWKRFPQLRNSFYFGSK
jgi:hypothetical protein